MEAARRRETCMGNQGRDSQTDEVLWISRREVARRGPQAGAPLGTSRTLPTLKRVALSPTSGPHSGILDKRFGQKADMAPSNLLFSLLGLQQGEILSDTDNDFFFLLPFCTPRQRYCSSSLGHEKGQHTARSTEHSTKHAASDARCLFRAQLPGHGREAC